MKLLPLTQDLIDGVSGKRGSPPEGERQREPQNSGDIRLLRYSREFKKTWNNTLKYWEKRRESRKGVGEQE